MESIKGTLLHPTPQGTTGTNDDNQSAEISKIDPKSEVSSNDNTVDEWLISISIKDDTCETKKKPQIERVPTRLHKSKQYTDCFEPLVVSIGPYHFEKQQLKEFEELKIPIAQKLCHDYCKEKSIKQLYLEVEKECGNALEYYEKDSIESLVEFKRKGSYEYLVNSQKLKFLIFLDACFVLYFIFFSEKDVFFKEDEKKVEEKDEKKVDARLNKNYYLVLRDLFLLENQIPLSVIQELMERLECEKKVIIDFILDFSQLLMPRLAHFMRSSNQTEKEPKLDGSPHLLDLVRENLYLIPGEPDIKHEMIDPALARRINLRESYRSVTDLVSAGIYFKPSKTRNLTDVKFKSCLCFGILTLPSIKVDHLTKTLLLNLVAYEMCPHGPFDTRIASYICLMDSLIDHADDVKELRKKRILVNKLGSDEDLAQLFNEIANDLVPVNDPYAYLLAKSMIDKHCKSIRHIWMAEWVHKYFSSPWTLMAFLGALLALALTMIQTYFSAYPRSTSNDKTF